MTTKRVASSLVLSIALLGCPSLAVSQAGGMTGMSGMDMGHEIVIPEGALYTRADVEFMQGMIAHHAQAIVMSRMAESHGANPQVMKLSNKIDQSQVPEIRIMQSWLTRNKQYAPDTSSWHHMMMSGMLTAAQLNELDAARGVDFDRAYLRLMIQHHAGALKMVDDLFNSSLAGQEVDVNVFANDVVTAQTVEIGIMQRLLTQLPAN
ncbi:MAG TPA: DUF305 domain-containing protein [Gemmatimonadaceae bacterium]|nr:DUF305 domain-containing protein [Gemmatimonadaceae bacterium]